MFSKKSITEQNKKIRCSEQKITGNMLKRRFQTQKNKTQLETILFQKIHSGNVDFKGETRTWFCDV